MSRSLLIQFPGARGSSRPTFFYAVISGFLIQGGGFVPHANMPVEALLVDSVGVRQ